MTKAVNPSSSSQGDYTSVQVGTNTVVPAGRTMANLNIDSLLTTISLVLDTTGIMRVENPYHSWRLLIWGGTIALVEEENELARTLLRKLRSQKVHLAEPEQLHEQMSGMVLYQAISQIYQDHTEVMRPILKEVLFENLLALYLEKDFTCIWHPVDNLPPLQLPTWKLNILDEVARRAVEQWQELKNIKHPHQTVQLLDQQSPIAFLPLFAKVTNGKFRITEIADEFKQHISRTAQKLDKLAEIRTVAILPLPLRQNKTQEIETAPNDINLSQIPEVMVIDDSPIQLKQMGELLKSWGYRIHLINDPHAAIQAMHQRKPNIAFMDINMPGLSGFDLIKEIRRDTELKDIELVLITSADNIQNKFRANWAKCRFLAKPRSSEDHHIQEFRGNLRKILREVVPLPTDVLV
ncbi:MAG: PleD family two-component system response regulator [Pseudanabaenaceae cyanobacterium]